MKFLRKKYSRKYCQAPIRRTNLVRRYCNSPLLLESREDETHRWYTYLVLFSQNQYRLRYRANETKNPSNLQRIRMKRMKHIKLVSES